MVINEMKGDITTQPLILHFEIGKIYFFKSRNRDEIDR